MDQRSIGRLIAIISVLMMVIGASIVRANGPFLLKAQEWLSGDTAAQYEILMQGYAKAPDDFNNEQEKRAYQIGEALFRSPSLLGGQAAKARISCNSCHLSGADNPIFHFPNISGAPGTADVTNSFFSSFRGNQNFDPIIIPDLRKMGKIAPQTSAQTNMLDNRQDNKQLRQFIRGLIVEEFNGQEPPKAALDAIIFYVQKINQAGVKPNDALISVNDPINIINQSVDNIQYNAQNGHNDVAIMLIGAMRHQLGLIYERYDDPQLKNAIVNSSQSLAQMGHNAGDNDGKSINRDALNIWSKQFSKLAIMLNEKEDESLFNSEKLKKAMP